MGEAVGRANLHAEPSAEGPAPAIRLAESHATRRALQPHFMLVPSLACPASCSYCFGPHEGPTMSPATMESSLDFIARIAAETRQRKVKVTFHGGEPLAAGIALWRQALDGLRCRLGPRRYDVALQSNLWLLDDAFCQLFREHKVDIGTSLDGPRDITDAQRGEGYFDRTMAGVRKAQAWGMKVGCIATFTPLSAPRWRQVFDFFLDQRLGFSIHPAVPPLHFPLPPGEGRVRGAGAGAALPLVAASGSLAVPDALGSTSEPLVATHWLTPEQYASLLRPMLDHYIAHRREIAVSSLDQMCQGVGCGEGKVCTFRDCLGMFLAIDPAGDVYPCQRFAGRPAWRLGTLADAPTLAELLDSPVARAMAERERRIAEACGDCPHLPYCRGGCPYNAWAGNGSSHEPGGDRSSLVVPPSGGLGPSSFGVPPSGGLQADPLKGGLQAEDRLKAGLQTKADSSARDPYCPAYRSTFDSIQSRLLEEMASEENINAIADRPWNGRGNPLLRKGPLIELAREGPHPSQTARTAKRIVAAVELARGPDLDAVAARLVAMGICRTQQSALASLEALDRRLRPQTTPRNNLYLHVTFGCQLRCTHCYARATPPAGSATPPPCNAADPARPERAYSEVSDPRGRVSALPQMPRASPEYPPAGEETRGRESGSEEMSPAALAQVIRQAKECGFRQVVITGGEPLVHSQRDLLLEVLAEARSWAAPMNLVLRTNLAMPLTEDDLRRIALAFDQVVVSIDGTEATHDARRGPGSYAAAVRNIEAYQKLHHGDTENTEKRTVGHASGGLGSEPQSLSSPSPHLCPSVESVDESSSSSIRVDSRPFAVPLFPAELSLACVLRTADIQGDAGHAVREVARRLGIRRTRFRPLLPLGRAADWDEPPTSEALGAHADPMDLIEAGFHPVASCGLGQNLYVEPSGQSFPCYAYHQPHSYLGNVIEARPSHNCQQAPADTATPCHSEPVEEPFKGLTHNERCAGMVQQAPESSFDKLTMTTGGRSSPSDGEPGQLRGLAAVLASAPFRDLARHTVDSNPKCRACDFRYLCGGACRAWGGEASERSPDGFATECSGLVMRGLRLLRSAWGFLEPTQPRMGDIPCSDV